MTTAAALPAGHEDPGARVLFVNSGILGLASFHRFLLETLPSQTRIRARHILLTERLTITDRVIRRLICQRFWKDDLLGIRNLDLARVRHELHAGLLARRRIAAIGIDDVDVIHFHLQAAAYGSLDLMRRRPCIVSMDSTQEVVANDASTRIERATYRPNVHLDGRIFRRAAAITPWSAWAAASLRRLYPSCATPVHVMPNPVLLHYFDPSWPDARRARAARGARPRLLFMGGDFPRKGGNDLLAAWTAGGFHDRAELEIVTNWDVRPPLPPGVSIVRNVHGYSAEWTERWAQADAFVMPTRNEAFGIVFQEAAAAGLPSIGTRLNAIPEIVLDGETGLLVPPGDLAALTAAIGQLVASAEMRDRLGRRGREHVERTAAADVCLRRLTAIIEGVMPGGRP